MSAAERDRQLAIARTAFRLKGALDSFDVASIEAEAELSDVNDRAVIRWGRRVFSEARMLHGMILNAVSEPVIVEVPPDTTPAGDVHPAKVDLFDTAEAS